MKKILILCAVLSVVAVLSSFIGQFEGDKPVPIPKSKQRVGNAQKGYEYLVAGDYVKGGIPYKFFRMAKGKSQSFLEREGDNRDLPHDFTAVKATNGEVLVAPNCLQCHAQVFNNQLVIGMGNSLANFTKQEKLNPKNFQLLETLLKLNPKQHEAAAPFLKVSKTVTPYILAEVQGVNTADRLASILAAHRDPVTFRWSDEPLMNIPEESIPTDVPAWWLLKKKNAMFYNGFGRGDFGRFLMASNLLTVTDTSESAQVNEHMPDVLAYLYSLEPPKYPYPVDKTLAAKGRVVFQKKCSSCHGTYGREETYPNLLIPESIIQTDSLLFKSNYSNPQFIEWFNKSWFTKGASPAYLQPFNGYIAPPLDGVWATGPYLHNGSVPTIEAVLNSAARPRYWSRDFSNPTYDYGKLGWLYSERQQPANNTVYNTDLPGYGNYGHYFGDALSDEERKAVIEYLKTL